MPLCFRGHRRRDAALVVPIFLGLLACEGGGSHGGKPSAAADPLRADLSAFDSGVAEALEGARTLVRRRPGDAQAWGLLGMAFEANFVPHLAVPAYTRAADLDPADAKWHLRRARTLEARGELDQADAAFAAAAACANSIAAVHWRLGFSLLRRGDVDAAEAAFRHALSMDPRQVPARIGLARVQLQRDAPEAAVTSLREALRFDPEDRYAHSLLGTALGRLELWSEAQEEMKRGRGANSDYGDPWEAEMLAKRIDTTGIAVLRAGELIERGEIREAIDILETLREKEPDDLTLLTQLTHAYTRGRRFAKAKRTALRCLEIEPRNLTASLNLAGIEAQQGNYDQACRILDAVAEAYPEDAQVHQSLGVVQVRRGETAQAIRAFHRAWQCDEERISLLFDTGMLELKLHRWEDARATFLQARGRGLDTPRLHVGLAKARLELGDVEGCEDALADVEGRLPADDPHLLQVQRELAARRARGGR